MNPLVPAILAAVAALAVGVEGCSHMYLVLGTDRHAVMEDRVHAAAYEIFRTQPNPSETCVTLAGKHKRADDEPTVPAEARSHPEAFIMFNMFHDVWKRLGIEWGGPRPTPRVFVEHQSTNTAENFVCATRLWRENRIPVMFELTIVTSDFHVDRSIHLAETIFQDDPVDKAYRFFFVDESDPKRPSDDPERMLRVIGSPDTNVPAFAVDLEPVHRAHIMADAIRARVASKCVYGSYGNQ